MTRTVTDLEFNTQVLQASGLSLVDFWAEWCGPCKVLGPRIEAIAEELSGKIQVFKINADENPKTSAEYNVRGLPTVLFIKDGRIVDTLVGSHSKETLLKTIEKHTS